MAYFGMQNLVQSLVLFRPSVLSLRVPTLLQAVAPDRHAVEEDGRWEQGLLPHG